MKNVVCLVLVLGPLMCWAQSDGKGVPLEGVKTLESTQAPLVAKLVGTDDLTLNQLRDRLALTAQQQAFWTAYASKVEAYTDAHYRQKPVLPAPGDAAPHQVGRLVDNLQNWLAALEDVESAAKILYASLVPEQQKIANQMLILTIPTFTPSNSDSSGSATDAHRKDNKPETGRRSHRGGAGGGLAGPMPGN
jgi:hypothetical protein